MGALVWGVSADWADAVAANDAQTTNALRRRARTAVPMVFPLLLFIGVLFLVQLP
jgi:hypothetical protein